MYYLLSMLIGCVVAGMIAINGGLTSLYGILGATVVIHIIGSVFAFAVILLCGKKLNITKNIPIWMFLGGAIGVLTTLANNFAFGKISMTSIVALGLFGQTLTSILIDSFGLFGMPKHKFNKYKLIGLVFAVIGMIVMMDDIENAVLIAIVFSLVAGVTIVLSRTVNANLSNKIGALQGSFINHFVGLPITIAILFLFGQNEPIFTNFTISPNPMIYIGGALGVIVVMLFNITVPKIQALNLTLLTFVGQVFTGLLLDIITKQGYSKSTFYGGIFIATGIFTNLILDYLKNKKESKAQG